MADIDLPVFSFRPNWREPLVERLSFLTDVLKSPTGAEQRRSLRQTPRRSFEADLLLSGPERAFWDLFVNRLGGGEMTVPLYWEVSKITAALASTSSDRITFDTTSREWEYQSGRLAMLQNDSALDYEVVEVAAVDAAGIDLVAPVERSWPKGTKIVPLRRGVIDQSGDLNHATAGVANVSVGFRLLGPNDWTPAVDASPVYGGLPVFLNEPNWVEELAVEYGRELALLDTGIGLTYQIDKLGRAVLGQAHRWFLPGRENLAAFRDLVYRHRGRAGAFWLPTFKADLRLVNSPGSSATQIEVENVGYLYTGGPTPGREYIAIKHAGGTILRKVLSVIPGTTSATEKLNLDLALGLALSPGQVRRISFADVGRFDTDDFEITHFGGVDSHHDVSATFRTFKNSRTSPAVIHYPIPPSPMNSVACGTPGFSGLSWLLPCGAPDGGGGCACAAAVSNSYVSGGDPSVVYDINLRVRGVIEFTAYSGGLAYGGGGRAYKNATGHSPSAFNTYRLEVSDPPASYYLNNGLSTEGVKAVDYEISVPVRGNATITLSAVANDGLELRNAGNVSVADDDPTNPVVVAQPYNGQFLQIDGTIL